jgi:hypothetical protein
MIVLIFVLGLVLIVMFASQPIPKKQFPSENIFEQRDKDDMMYKVFIQPTPWQQIGGNYTAYKGDNYYALSS